MYFTYLASSKCVSTELSVKYWQTTHLFSVKISNLVQYPLVAWAALWDSFMVMFSRSQRVGVRDRGLVQYRKQLTGISTSLFASNKNHDLSTDSGSKAVSLVWPTCTLCGCHPPLSDSAVALHQFKEGKKWPLHLIQAAFTLSANWIYCCNLHDVQKWRPAGTPHRHWT